MLGQLHCYSRVTVLLLLCCIDWVLGYRSFLMAHIFFSHSSLGDRSYVAHYCQNETLLYTWSQLNSWYIVKLYILPYVMVVKILKSDNHNQGSYYAFWPLGYWKVWNGEISFLSLWVYEWVNCQFGQKSSKLYYVSLK